MTIHMEAAPGGWCFEVGDNGPGIPAQFHAAVFDAFRQLRPKDEVEGSGVGLSIVKRSMETLGGSVVLRSSPGEGCTFELFWPLAEEGEGEGACLRWDVPEVPEPVRAATALAA